MVSYCFLTLAVTTYTKTEVQPFVNVINIIKHYFYSISVFYFSLTQPFHVGKEFVSSSAERRNSIKKLLFQILQMKMVEFSEYVMVC